jgi:glycosyltransferase involved in cell wall biosynthesis
MKPLKVYLNKANENWIADRFRREWYQYNKEISTNRVNKSNLIWVLSPWTWNKLNRKNLDQKKVLCTVHHIDSAKFNNEQKKNFYELDQYVKSYHAVSDITKNQLSELTNKKIYSIPFWLNQNIWYPIINKTEIREKYDIPIDSYVIGTFQRDTEGHDLKSPKLSKGPDQFLEIILKYKEKNPNLYIVLTGKRRQWLINNLKIHNVSYKYIEMASFEKINELYNCLDLYIVASRVEGGPQAIPECAITETPIVSTNVGLASQLLSKNSIFNMDNYEKVKPDTKYALEKIQEMKIPGGFKKFTNMLKEINES